MREKSVCLEWGRVEIDEGVWFEWIQVDIKRKGLKNVGIQFVRATVILREFVFWFQMLGKGGGKTECATLMVASEF